MEFSKEVHMRHIHPKFQFSAAEGGGVFLCSQKTQSAMPCHAMPCETVEALASEIVSHALGVWRLMRAEGDGTVQMSARTAEMSAPSRNLPLDLSDFLFLTIRILSGYHADTPITIKAEASCKADSCIH